MQREIEIIHNFQLTRCTHIWQLTEHSSLWNTWRCEFELTTQRRLPLREPADLHKIAFGSFAAGRYWRSPCLGEAVVILILRLLRKTKLQLRKAGHSSILECANCQTFRTITSQVCACTLCLSDFESDIECTSQLHLTQNNTLCSNVSRCANWCDKLMTIDQQALWNCMDSAVACDFHTATNFTCPLSVYIISWNDWLALALHWLAKP